MPSSKNYIRDIPQETKTAKARGEVAKNNERKVARRVLVKEGVLSTGDGKDADHIKPLSKGGTTTRSNLRAKPASDNRSFPRNPDGSMKK
jgi:hypothetical protein